MAIKVKLRKKRISKGRYSLYLDYYPPIPHPKTGKLTRRKFLGLYIFIDKAEIKKEISKEKQNGYNPLNLIKLHKELKPLTPIDKTHNKETIKLAMSIRQKEDNQINKPEIYNEYEKEQLLKKKLGELNFIDYFRELANKRSSSNYDSWISALYYIEKFFDGDIKFHELNEKKLEDFKEYLLSTNSKRSTKSKLSTNSASSYFNKIKSALKQAYIDGILQVDLYAKTKSIREEETRREYLTLEELNKLAKTPCNDPTLKRAALFSALTGLRFSDIQKMTWNELEYTDGAGYSLKYEQKKTKGVEVLPISDQAFNFTEGLADPRKMPQQELVFKGLKYSAYKNKHLYKWIVDAGISKDITFHCFRHTYATLQLVGGTDIYTVSKMLGHKDLKTTQVYAKIVDKAKRKAADSIKLDI